ncbi:diguanylate cyclase (GGDEF)-like protein [Novosphingobium chloroacetimidivorans]|uniref:diguanylate cyclase n=1 Tax=Novosphingobium chloroacetimidivorans TaxID=1428314 RepID=A0A7W7KEF9_9SPHN|nr:GGDEF domain-containing protein [Novosphingobium chloroacetimidivorans]MBB4860911.1 diguanylate cyclase (GGDEF)-like protein [Novosphingobium chloroacetimidivorans]
MFTSIDLATLRLCSALACVTFVIIFASLWRGRKDQLHHAHWAASLLLYCVTLGGLEWIYLPDDVLIRALLLAALTASNIPVVTGVRIFAGRPLWRWWMGIPPAATLIGFLLPHLARTGGVELPAGSEQVLATLGLALGMGVFGVDIIRQSDRAMPRGYGGRIAGLAMIAYIPCYLYAIAGEVLHMATPSTLAVAALLSDQLLLMLLNLSLLAMPTEAALAALRERTWQDGLTKVYNRAWLQTNEDALLKVGTWLAHIDVDHFKSINDRFGHAAGDAALIGLARALSAAAQESKTQRSGHVVRMGGDEFLVIMPQASLVTAERLAQHVRAAVSGIGPFECTVSTGLAAVEAHDRSFSDAIERADRQLYAAKLAGRDRIAA